MKYQSHGDHWDALFKSTDDIMHCLNGIAENSEFLYGRETSFNDGDKSFERAGIYAIEKDDGPIGIRTLVYDDEEAKVNRLVSSYPVGKPLDCCKPVTLHHSIDQWDDRIEANIEGETDYEFPRSVNFFSTDYLPNKHLIRLVDKASYNLVAFALNCEFTPADQDELRLEGQKAVDFLSKMKKEPKYNEKGEVEPVVIGLRDMVAFLPNEKDFPDIVQFRSPVSNVESFTSFGVPMYRMMITIDREEEDVNLTLYARQEFFDHMPKENEPIHGVMWIQGEMTTSLMEEVSAAEPKNCISETSSSFIQAIGDIDLHCYDDLMVLVKSFDDLRIKEGYVLDGFWADKDGQSYTKLYFSAEGSEWRYIPELIDGKITPEFNDKMYIHNHVDEGLVENLPQLTEYIEGPFTEKAIWEVYLLISSRYYLPLTKGLGDTLRTQINRRLDFVKVDDESCGVYYNDERVFSGVKIIDDSKAMVSCTFWSKRTGLCVEKTVVSRAGNGYQFGVPRIISIA